MIAAGADGLKLFPAEASPPRVLRALRAVLPPDVPVLPVGSITPGSLAEYRAAGADGFGLGSALYKQGDTPDTVAAKATAFMSALRALASDPKGRHGPRGTALKTSARRRGHRAEARDGLRRASQRGRAIPLCKPKECIMIGVVFEVWPAEGRSPEYFDMAASMRSELEHIDGFISVERFESLTTKGKYLSLSFWRDEEAVRAWRNLAVHRHAQAMGRGGMFADYRIRVVSVMRDYGLEDRANAPRDSRAAHG